MRRDERFVEHADAATGDGAHRKLRMTRRTELAHDENVERRVQMTGDFVADGNAAARQCQDDEIGSSRVQVQVLREHRSRLTTIGEPCRHVWALNRHGSRSCKCGTSCASHTRPAAPDWRCG